MVILVTGNSNPHKKIEYMMVALPEFIYKKWLFSRREMSELASPFPDTLPTEANHLRGNVRKQSIDSAAVIGDFDCYGTGMTNRLIG